jgi:hypothetical protein
LQGLQKYRCRPLTTPSLIGSIVWHFGQFILKIYIIYTKLAKP